MTDEVEILYARDHHGDIEFIFNHGPSRHFCSAKVSPKRTHRGYKDGNILDLLVCRTRFYDVTDDDVLFVFGRAKSSHKRVVMVDQAPDGLVDQIVKWLEERYPPKE